MQGCSVCLNYTWMTRCKVYHPGAPQKYNGIEILFFQESSIEIVILFFKTLSSTKHSAAQKQSSCTRDNFFISTCK